MIISHKHKYVFVCLPRTGTTALRKELCENYGGTEIHYKHAPYHVFLKNASPEEKRYKLISSVRNPLDRIVSIYFKYKSNHDSIEKGQIKNIGDKNIIQKFFVRIANNLLGKRNSFVIKNNPSFSEFFLKFYKRPYSDWHSLYFNKYDYIIRFENIQEDFKNTINGLGLELIRPLPVVNKTDKIKASFETFYTPETWARAIHVFYQSMNMYGYNFPENWPNIKPGKSNRFRYKIINVVRKIYWEKIR
ncbi:MAG: hypothetical protein BalsKO_20270 [Balneolaceae bacterium]